MGFTINSSALRGSSVLLYTMAVRYEVVTGTCTAYLQKLVSLRVLSMITIGGLHTKPPPYDCLKLYGACLDGLGTPEAR